jgi:carboxylesterase type B
VELTKLPWDLLEAGAFNLNVPLLLGYNKDEGTIELPMPDFSKGNSMDSADFHTSLVNMFLGNMTNVAEAEAVYALNQTTGNNETKAYTDYYWAGTHIKGDYSFSCPTRRAARAFTKYAPTQPVYMYNFVHTPLAPPFGWAGVPGQYARVRIPAHPIGTHSLWTILGRPPKMVCYPSTHTLSLTHTHTHTLTLTHTPTTTPSFFSLLD